MLPSVESDASNHSVILKNETGCAVTSHVSKLQILEPTSKDSDSINGPAVNTGPGGSGPAGPGVGAAHLDNTTWSPSLTVSLSHTLTPPRNRAPLGLEEVSFLRSHAEHGGAVHGHHVRMCKARAAPEQRSGPTGGSPALPVALRTQASCLTPLCRTNADEGPFRLLWGPNSLHARAWASGPRAGALRVSPKLHTRAVRAGHRSLPGRPDRRPSTGPPLSITTLRSLSLDIFVSLRMPPPHRGERSGRRADALF